MGNRNALALAENALDTGHDIDWNGVQVLDRCELLKQRLLLESW